MRAFSIWVLILGGIVYMSGCSTTSVSRVTGDPNAKGLRYWLAAPYVLVGAPVEVSRTEQVYRLEGEVLTLVQPSKWLPGDSAGTYPPNPPAPAAGGSAGVLTPPPMPGSRTKRAAPGKAGADKVKQPNKAENKAPETETTPVEDHANEGAAAKDATAAPKADKGSSAANTIAIVWLPDYCEQYAVEQSNTLSTASMKITLADGAKFDHLDSSNDSSAAVGKLLDTVAAVAGKAIDAGKDVKVATIQKEAASKAASSALGAQATKGLLLRRTISSSLKPGLYPMFERPADKDGKTDCNATPRLSSALAGAAISTVESWTELPLSRAEQ